jgi:hypothetical protein
MDKNNDKRLIEAAKLLKEHYRQANCPSCIFNNYADCSSEYPNGDAPCDWNIPAIREE